MRPRRDATYLRAPRWLRRGVLEPLAGIVGPDRALKMRRADAFRTDPGLYFHECRSLRFRPSVRRALGNTRPLPEPVQRKFFPEFEADYTSAALRADIATHLVDDLLILPDRTSMAVGVESRVPLLDHRLVELGLAMPTDVRNPGGRQKGLDRGWWTKEGVERAMADIDRYADAIYILLALELAILIHVEGPTRSEAPTESLAELI